MYSIYKILIHCGLNHLTQFHGRTFEGTKQLLGIAFHQIKVYKFSQKVVYAWFKNIN